MLATRRFAVTAAALLGLALAGATAAHAQAQGLPPLPEAIKKQGMIRIGVKCDYPPDGFLDAQGKNQGVEVNLAKQLGIYAFGSAEKVELSCVTAANRIPALQGGKIDAIVATLGVSAERAQVIDFSDNYAWGGSDVLTPQGSTIKALPEFAGKKVIVMKGAWQIGWFEKNVPTAELLKLDSIADGLQALMQGRADGFAHDVDVLRPIAKKNPRVKLVGEIYQMGTRAVGIRKGEKEWTTYVNAAIAKAKTDGLITQWIKQYVETDLQDLVIESWDMSKAPKNAS
ncbi:MAG: transporter substrate-binding domain-containing protein [Alphaproteobacteria bacterium]|nr:transporter substrate-binding domain-containing protein [Alphaproteobacteria bacterium]